MVKEKEDPVVGQQNPARDAIKISKEKEEILFVGLNKPRELRRDMLEALRDTISLLQKSERIKKVRAARYDSIMNLKSKVSELSADLTKLEQLLPKHNFEIEEPEPKERKTEQVGAVKHTATAAQKSKVKDKHIKQLERELAEVEAKLKLL